jgi:DNA-directed RNA polymerase subunit RPC12/RpoP
MRCGKRIEDTADMKEDGFCVKCGNEFIAECEKYHGESR